MFKYKHTFMHIQTGCLNDNKERFTHIYITFLTCLNIISYKHTFMHIRTGCLNDNKGRF